MSFIVSPPASGGGAVPIPAGQVAFGTGTSITGDADFVYDPSGNILQVAGINGGAAVFSASVTAATFAAPTFTGGDYSGGALTLTGAAVAASYTGSTINLTVTPASPTAAQAAGTLTLRGQAATGATFGGGALQLIGGAGMTSGSGGAISLTGGASTSGSAGTISLSAGSSNSGAPGNITLVAGLTFGAVPGGSITLTPGISIGGGGNGSVSLRNSAGANRVQVDSTGLGFYGVATVARPTTAIAGAAFTANVGTPVMDTSTFDGYTIGQWIAAGRALGLLT